MEFLKYVVYGNTMENWLTAAGIAIAVYIALVLLKKLLVRRVGAFTARTATDVDDLIVDLVRKTRFYFLAAVGVTAGAHFLRIPHGVLVIIDDVAIICVMLQVALWGNQLVAYLIARHVRSRSDSESAAASAAVLGFIGRIVLWSLVVLLVLDNLGVNVTALIAGLGIGGVAIALAVQNILGDLFASLSIMIDKPFVAGDSISVDAFNGTVEHVGLKTTRLRSITGEQLIFSNADLLKSRIRNFKRMEERRVTFPLGVVYGTPADKLKSIPEIVRGIVEGEELARYDRAHFKEFGPSSLNFEVSYHVLNPEFSAYLDVNERINLAIVEKFAEEGIVFAYPTQTLHVEMKR
jgi:small-conductance mechanosensitive channel